METWADPDKKAEALDTAALSQSGKATVISVPYLLIRVRRGCPVNRYDNWPFLRTAKCHPRCP